MSWRDADAVEWSNRTGERLQLHFGVYILASAAHSMLPHAKDDSHSNLEFDVSRSSFITRVLVDGLTLQLDLVPLEIVLCQGDVVKNSLSLFGRSVDDALGWIERALEAEGVVASIARRAYPDFPASPLMQDGSFSSAGEAERRELGVWFGNALDLMGGIQPSESAMSALRIWPHHFDLGALISISEDETRSIGLGFSPGDAQIPEPYFYCSPYPAPDAGVVLPPLPTGAWTRDGFTSAILTATEIQAADSQASCAERYLEAAVSGCRALIDSDPSTSSF